MQVLCIVLMKLLIKRQKQKHKTTKQTASVEGGKRQPARPLSGPRNRSQYVVSYSTLFYIIIMSLQVYLTCNNTSLKRPISRLPEARTLKRQG